MFTRLLSALIVIASLGAQGCRRADDSGPKRTLSGDRKARILATTGMIADITREIGGERVDVDCLMGPGVDPHRYIPKADDFTRLNKADLVLYNGLHLEGKMTDVFEEMATKVRTVAVTDRLDPKTELRAAEEGFETEYDPHVWFDVRLWMKATERVRDALAELDPTHAEKYKANAARYLKELAALHEEVLAKAQKLPEGRRVLITAHDAFGYFGAAYGFEVKGLQGVSTGSDTSVADVRELANFIGRNKIPAIFGETSVPDRGIKAVLETVRKEYKFEARMAEATLFSDALGDAGTATGTYIGMVRHNIDAIVEALSK